MARRVNEQLTPLELELMQALWAGGPSTVAEVQGRMAGEQAYTTVQTMLNILERKGRVKHVLKGKAYVYRALVTREKAMGSAMRDMLQRMFGGSAEALLLSLMEAERIEPEELERLARKVAEAERAAGSKGGEEER